MCKVTNNFLFDLCTGPKNREHYNEEKTPEPDFVTGDANGDGQVTITDAVAIVNSILGNSSAGFNEAAADVNGDGNITITDAVGVVNIILQ